MDWRSLTCKYVIAIFLISSRAEQNVPLWKYGEEKAQHLRKLKKENRSDFRTGHWHSDNNLEV